MNAPLDTIGSSDTPRSDVRAAARRARLQSILEQLKALGPKPVQYPAPAPMPMSATDEKPQAEAMDVTGVIEHHGSAWAEAVRIGKVRACRKARGLDASVRAIATEVGCSRGRAGECLQINDAFNNTLLWFIGDNGSLGDGRARLARLSFRTLRTLARLSTDLERFREARRLSNR